MADIKVPEIDIEPGIVLVGQDITLQFGCRTMDGHETPIDMDGWNLAFAVRKKDTDDGAPLLLITSVAGKITLTTSAKGVAAGVSNDVANVQIRAIDSYNAGVTLLPDRQYRYGIARVDAGVHTTWLRGGIYFTPVASK